RRRIARAHRTRSFRPCRARPSRRAPADRRRRGRWPGPVHRRAEGRPRLERWPGEEASGGRVQRARRRGPGRHLPPPHVLAAVLSADVRNPSARTVRRALDWYPPLRFAGVRVLEISDDWRHARVMLRRHWYNRNYVGTHFGGSLFAMTDPFWMILTLRSFGDGYIVWDKAA